MELFMNTRSEDNKSTVDLARYFPLGNEELDRNFGGGVSMNNVIYVYGSLSAGKSILAQQVAFGAVKAGKRVTYITSEHTVRGLIDNMQTLSWNIAPFFNRGAFTIVPVITSMASILRSSNLFLKLVSAVSQVEDDVVIIDAISHFAGESPPIKLLQFFFELCKKKTLEGKTILITCPDYIVTLNELVLLKCANLIDSLVKIVMNPEENNRREIHLLKWKVCEEPSKPLTVFTVDPAFGIAVEVVSSA